MHQRQMPAGLQGFPVPQLPPFVAPAQSSSLETFVNSRALAKTADVAQWTFGLRKPNLDQGQVCLRIGTMFALESRTSGGRNENRWRRPRFGTLCFRLL